MTRVSAERCIPHVAIAQILLPRPSWVKGVVFNSWGQHVECATCNKSRHFLFCYLIVRNGEPHLQSITCKSWSHLWLRCIILTSDRLGSQGLYMVTISISVTYRHIFKVLVLWSANVNYLCWSMLKIWPHLYSDRRVYNQYILATRWHFMLTWNLTFHNHTTNPNPIIG